MRLRYATVLLWTLGWLVLPAQAGDDPELGVVPREAPLAVLLRQVSPHLDAPIVWNPDDRQLGRTTVIGSLRLDFQGLDRPRRVGVVRSLLAFYDFDLVRCEPRETPVYVLVRKAPVRVGSARERLSLDRSTLLAASRQSGRVVTAALPLSGSARTGGDVADTALGLLTPRPESKAEYIPATRTLMVRGDAPRVAAIARFLRAAGLLRPELRR